MQNVSFETQDPPFVASVAAVKHDEERRSAYADILSQAITGELIGMESFAMMALITDDVSEKVAAIENSHTEKAHAQAFIRAADKLGLQVKIDLDAPYWAKVRKQFKAYIDARDVIACQFSQEIMLESFAVNMYRNLGKTLGDATGDLFTKIANDEEKHLSHHIAELRQDRARDPETFDAHLYRVHMEFMSLLVEMSDDDDSHGSCGLCSGGCVKDKLATVNLDITRLRGGSLEVYLTILDEVGVPGEKTLQWMCELPT